MLGKIELIMGPMFSGKTTELFRLLNEYNNNYKCVAIKSTLENRYSNTNIITHDRLKINKNIPVIISDTISNAISEYNIDKYDVIGIDEGHFFKDISDCCDKLAYDNKIIIVSALNSTYERKPFQNISNLISITDSDLIRSLSGKCQFCSDKSIFTKRLINDDRLLLIGGSDIYAPVCRLHYK